MPPSSRSVRRGRWRTRAVFLLAAVIATAVALVLGPLRARRRPTVSTPVTSATRGVAGPKLPCPEEMALVGTSCVDRYEGSLVVILPNGREAPFSPYMTPTGYEVRAVSYAAVVPQGHISLAQVKRACAASGKRACHVDEWKRACKGSAGTRYPYGKERIAGVCNDSGIAPVSKLYFGPEMYGAKAMNDARLNQMPNTVTKTGEAKGCTNDFGVYDMVGNLHEWLDDGAFHGGFYLDVTTNREGCDYTTVLHEEDYRDYSTGFRCCKDASLPATPEPSAH
jgi:sulfatase modifying factor 1